ncbi:hypothetical protein CEV32_0195 [Brucella rhizosphaerae]|uniref:Uncharacterized protein n=1 Tax=Brucella rhizosphaerae TaxID=571254 RepID=A0A256FH61_9HYPH|nr:hypothetical protein CEV32_0195 [Brucella rhizosphaerae]
MRLSMSEKPVPNFQQHTLIMSLLNPLPKVCKPGTPRTEINCAQIFNQKTGLTDAAVPK